MCLLIIIDPLRYARGASRSGAPEALKAAAPSRRRVPDRASGVHAVGIDLAWGDHPSGIAHLVADDDRAGAWRLLETRHLGTHAAVLAWMDDRLPGEARAWTAVDAPLAASNEPGTLRPCEAAFRHDFVPFRVACYPTDPIKAARSVALRRALEARGHVFGPPVAAGTERGVFETFPTAAQLSLFERRRPIRYKHGDAATRREGLRSLQMALAGLDDAALPLADTPALRELLRTDPSTLQGAKLKGLEDRLDSLLCALVAALAWRAPGRLATYGDVASGFMTVPHPPAAP